MREGIASSLCQSLRSGLEVRAGNRELGRDVDTHQYTHAHSLYFHICTGNNNSLGNKQANKNKASTARKEGNWNLDSELS